MEDKLAYSLGAQTTELIPYLPYLLQDLWELGGMPGDVCALLQPHVSMEKELRVLDLACGKGAVGISLAKRSVAGSRESTCCLHSLRLRAIWPFITAWGNCANLRR
jgi:hypothetical protein